MKGRTQKTHEFSECTWKGCPDYVNKDRKYLMNEKNQKAVTKENCDTYCTTIGNTHLPQSNATSWSIKILKSINNDGDRIYIGVAPFDIDQNEDKNCIKCGWYFYCFNSTLWSGPPHNYGGKGHSTRKKVENMSKQEIVWEL